MKKQRITIDGIEYELTPVKNEQEGKRISGYYIAADATISHSVEVPDTPNNFNIFATEKLAKRALAMARISQKMANDERFGGVVTDKEWKEGEWKFILERRDDEVQIVIYAKDYSFLAFHTREQAELFLQENKDLIRDYLMFD